MSAREDDIKRLVIARLETLPPDMKVSVGASGEFTPNELVDHVKRGDPLGKKFIQIEMEFLRAMKEGLIS